MKKASFLILCCLWCCQVVVSQTIASATILNRKLSHDFYSIEPSASIIYYLKYQVKNGALISLDDTSITDSILKKNIRDFYKRNGDNISWKSVLNIDNSEKTVDVVHPIFILSDLGKRESYGSDLPFNKVYAAFFDKIFSTNPVLFLPPILLRYSVPEPGSR